MLNRVRHSGGSFTSVPNEVIRQEMSCEAFWFLCLVMSLPDAWNFTVEGMIAMTNKSKHCITKSIKELKALELCKVVSRRRDGGTIKGWDYFFRWTKNEEWSEFEPHSEKPQSGKTTIRQNQNVEIQPQINKDIIKKEEIKKEGEALTLPFSSDKFRTLWETLIQQPKWKRKSKASLKMNLTKLANYPEDFAIALVEDAIAGEWQGVVFSDTPQKFEEWRKSRKEDTKKITSMEQLRNGKR